MSVTVRAKLPKSDHNGLAHLEGRLAEDTDTPLVVVGLIRADTIEARPHDDDNPRLVKTVLLHVEAVDGSDAEQVEKLMRVIHESRTGKIALPFEEDGDEDGDR
jgi:hypothetical protein